MKSIDLEGILDKVHKEHSKISGPGSPYFDTHSMYMQAMREAVELALDMASDEAKIQIEELKSGAQFATRSVDKQSILALKSRIK